MKVALGIVLAVASAAATADQFEACRSKLIQLQKLEVLYDLKWDKGREPRVVAGPTFFEMPIDGKEAFVETVNCFLMVGAKKCISFDVLSWKTGNPVGRYSNCRYRHKNQ